MKTKLLIIISLVLFGVVGMSNSFGQTVQWSSQFGSDSFDSSNSVAVDSLGNVYVTGSTDGNLFDVLSGESDVFVVKYDTDGNELWSKQFGSELRNWGNSVAVDSLGNVYVTGSIGGDLFGKFSGKSDVFVIKYDTDGNELWSKQFGSEFHDIGIGIAIDSLGNTYVTGRTGGNLFDVNIGSDDVFVIKYDTSGNELWSKQFGNDSAAEGISIAVDSSDNAYVAGYAIGDLFDTGVGKLDVFVIKYDTDGNELWSKQFGSEFYDIGIRIAIDSLDNVYVTGKTDGNLFGTDTGEFNVFVVKYDTDGNELWSKQFANNSPEERGSIAIDSLDNVYVTGSTGSDLFDTHVGSDDVFVVKYDTDGNKLWSKQFGSTLDDWSTDVTGDSFGNAYVIGTTTGNLFGTNFGEHDIFIVKYNSHALASKPTIASTCDVGTELVNGICQVIKTEKTKTISDDEKINWLKANYSSTDTGVIRLNDPNMDLNSKIVDNFDVDVWSDTDFAGIDLTITETGDATGIFEGTVYFTMTDDSSGHRLLVSSGDTIYSKHDDNTLSESFDDDKIDLISTASIHGMNTIIEDRVSLDKKSYMWNDTVFITINAPEENLDTDLIDVIDSSKDSVQITTRHFEIDNYNLAETGINSGVFIGEIILVDKFNDLNSDGLSVFYEYEEDVVAIGSAPIILNSDPENIIDERCGVDTVSIDGVCQVVKTKTVGDDAPFFGIFVYLDDLISWILGK